MNLSHESRSPLGERFEQALIYTHQLHRHQLRKGSNIPYITHLLGVVALVLEDGGNEDCAIAALLHDAVEDQGGLATQAAIADQFGEPVATWVAACSESTVSPKPPWRERKEQYLEHLQTASDVVIRIALADKLHNARSLLTDWQRQPDQVWDKFNASRSEIQWFYRACLAIFQQRSQSPMVSQLEATLRLLSII